MNNNVEYGWRTTHGLPTTAFARSVASADQPPPRTTLPHIASKMEARVVR